MRVEQRLALALPWAVMVLVWAALAHAGAFPESGPRLSGPTGPGVGELAGPREGAVARGNREVPGLLKSASLACTMTQASYVGTGTVRDAAGKGNNEVQVFEAACGEGLGYVIDVVKGQVTATSDCVMAAQSGKLNCMLAKNRPVAVELKPYLGLAGVACDPQRARFVGKDEGAKLRRYEVACGQGGGYMLDIALADGTGVAPTAVDCLRAGNACSLTPHSESVAMLSKAITPSLESGCEVDDARYVGFVPTEHLELYEVSCKASHDGRLIEIDDHYAVRKSFPCANTKLVGASCALKTPAGIVAP